MLGVSKNNEGTNRSMTTMTEETVDMQALTRFMTLIEASPFIQNVQLARTDATIPLVDRFFQRAR